MCNTHPYFSLKYLGKSEHYTWQNTVLLTVSQVSSHVSSHLPSLQPLHRFQLHKVPGTQLFQFQRTEVLPLAQNILQTDAHLWCGFRWCRSNHPFQWWLRIPIDGFKGNRKTETVKLIQSAVSQAIDNGKTLVSNVCITSHSKFYVFQHSPSPVWHDIQWTISEF